MATHQNQPVFHLYDPSGWVNDPNGPFYYNGKYHMFFQNVADSNKWTWGLGWGHATSTDLLHWQHQPVALEPEAGWYDADGCFSGCATIDTDGTPAILYTGVAKKPDAGEREGMPMTVNKLCNERQLLARPADPNDPDLKVWIKEREPFISDHMSGLPLNCFRDPFILEKPDDSNDNRWRIMVGSNIEAPVTNSDAGSGDSDGQVTTLGTVTVYRSKTEHLNGGWEYDGLLCVAKPGEGAIWECPILVPMQLPQQNGKTVKQRSKAAAAAAKDTKHSRDTVSASTAEGTAATAAAADGVATTAAVAAARRELGSSKAGLKGAVAVIAEETQQELARQQQEQDEDLDRAMSGCMGLFTASQGNSRRSSTDAGSSAVSSSDSNAQISAPAAAAALLSKQQKEQKRAGRLKALGGSSIDPLAPTHLFSVSAGVCPAIYWLGKYGEGRFDLDNASGPHALDLGDVLYAPNLLEDAQGRQIIWGWLQEHPSPFSHDYAGCISMPRQLTLGVKQHKKTADTFGSLASIRRRSSSSSLDALIQSSGGGLNVDRQQQQQQQQDDGTAAASGSSISDVEYYLIQTPLPELDQLRSGRGIRLRGIQLPAGKPWSVPSQVSASHLDLSINVRPTPGCKRIQILLGPLRQTSTEQQQEQQQQHHTGALAAAVGANAADAATAAAAEAAMAAATAGADAATIAAAAAAAATEALMSAQQVLPGAVGTNSTFVPIMGSVANTAAPAAPAVTSPTAGGGIPSLPHSPVAGGGVPSVLPMLPSVVPGELAATAAAAAAANGTSFPDNNSTGPFVDAQTPTAAGTGSSNDFTSAAARSASRGSLTSIGNDAAGNAEYSESAAAAAAAAAIEQIAQEHHQAAAITYEFATAQLQVLVGPPSAVLKLLKHQQEELAAAAGSSAGSPPTAAAAAGANGTMARSAMPTSEKLGFEPPVFPPAPPGSLSDYNFMQAAQAAGVRVLACQLRDLDPDQPFEMRILLDYSIIEAFFSTGEALTTRVYRGVPTARAKEASMRKVAAHAATEAVEAASAEISDQISVSGSLANLGLLLQQQLVRSGSGRLLSAAATPRAGSLAANWSAAVGGGLSSNPLSPSNAITGAASYFSSSAAVQSFDSPAESPTQGAHGSSRILTHSQSAITSSVVSTIRVSNPSAGLESPETLSGLGGLGSPTFSGRLSGGLTHVISAHPRRVSAPASLHIPYSPKTVAYGSYVQYFSPARVVSARVGWRQPNATGLPTLAGIMEDQAAAAAAAAGPGDQPVQAGSSSSNVGAAVAELLRPAAAAAVPAEDEGTSDRATDINAVVQDPSAAAAAAAAAAAVPAEAPAGPSNSSSSKPLASKVRVGKLMIPGGGAATPAAAPTASTAAPPAPAPTAPTADRAQAALRAASAAAAQPAAAPAAALDIGSPDRAATAAAQPDEPAPGAFPGFSPHRPSISDDMPNAAFDLGAVAAAAAQRQSDGGSSGSSTTGEKLTSWFQKLTKKGSKKEQSASGDGSTTSSTSRVVVPPNFGQAMPSPFSPHPAASDAAAAAAADGGDMSPSKARDQARDAAAHRAAAAVTKPGLQIRTSSSGGKTVSAGSSSVATTEAAPESSTATGSSSTGTHVGSSTYSTTRQHHTGRSSADSGSGTGSQPDSGKSPQSRRNWRSAFVISDLSDDEGQITKPSDQIGPGISPWTADQIAARLGSQAASGLGAFSQPGTIRTSTPFGVLHSDPQIAEFGMYAKVVAPGQSSTAAVGGTGSPAGIKLRGKVGKQVVDTISVGKGSGYVPGAMREVSLVALGGGGVVLRLEAHEMNSMWDECPEYKWTGSCDRC